MEEQKKISAIAKDFVEAQKEFEKTGLNGENPHFRSEYADLAACVNAIKPALNSHGFSLVQKTYECEVGAKVETLFIHESGEQISGGILVIPAEAKTPQKFGSALTYARRYSLLTAAGVPPEPMLDDDAEAVTDHSKDKQKAPQAKKFTA